MKEDYSGTCNGNDDDLKNPCMQCSQFCFPIGCMVDEVQESYQDLVTKCTKRQLEGCGKVCTKCPLHARLQHYREGMNKVSNKYVLYVMGNKDKKVAFTMEVNGEPCNYSGTFNLMDAEQFDEFRLTLGAQIINVSGTVSQREHVGVIKPDGQ